MDTIVKKSNTIKELLTNQTNIISTNENIEVNNQNIEVNNQNIEVNNENIEVNNQNIESLTLNNIIITSRIEDNFINANQLCQAGNKKFNDWYILDSTKHLINELESETKIPCSQLLDIIKENSSDLNQNIWIHPYLAIQLAQFISHKFALQVNEWIRNLFINSKVKINIKLLDEIRSKENEIRSKENEIKSKENRIKILENTYLKKHSRKKYPINVIYLLTTEDHFKNRTYIIGKTTNLTNRLSVYNKTCDHQVVYYEKCIDKQMMNVVELLILNKLKQYQEVANRDRFILPLGNNISLFINIIKKCINFF